jgi:drug/metabolite transporter (DMT)-like permease
MGIVMAFFGRSRQPAGGATGNILWGDFLGLLAGVSWGATTVVLRCSSLARSTAAQALLYQLVGAFVLLLAAAIGLGETAFSPTPLALGSSLFQALVVSFASYLTWLWLLRNYLASRLGVFSFMTPFFGIAFGVWLLHEPLEASFVAGAVLVIAGIVLVSGYGWLKQVLHGGKA